VLLDAPCGDLNWISTLDLGGVTYIGVDTSEANLSRARENAVLDVRRADIVDGRLPEADTVLCRDFLQHLPNAMAQRALDNLASTGARWLLATSFDNEANADIADVGGFLPLNLTAPPFDLGEPQEAIPDGPGRIVGVWPLRC
jgi:SAM-dependent methyltransferase